MEMIELPSRLDALDAIVEALPDDVDMQPILDAFLALGVTVREMEDVGLLYELFTGPPA